MEEWNAGMLGERTEIIHYNCEKLLQTHHSITPSFHRSNWGEALKFYLAPLPKSTIFMVRMIIIKSMKVDIFLM